MSKYQFKINDVVVKHPTNWESIVLGYNYDAEKAGSKEIAQMIWCDAETRAQFEAAEQVMPCQNLTFKICFLCQPGDTYEEIFATTIELKDLILTCDNCDTEVGTKRQGASSIMDEFAGDEACFFTDTDLELFQFQSGGFYTDIETNQNISASFISILDLVNRFISYYYPGGASTVNNLPENDASFYQPATATLTPPAVPAGQTILRVEGEFGQVYNMTIEAGSPDVDTYLQRICNALCCVADGATISMNALEFNSRIAFCDVENGTLTISAYWDFVEVTVSDAGGVLPWGTANLIPQQRSGADLYISPKGLFGNQVCLSWQDLKDLINTLQGGYIREIHDSDRFEFRQICELGNQLPATSPENIVIDEATNAKRSKNKEWMVNRVIAGSEFRVEDFEGDSNTEDGTWVWQSPAIPGPIGFPADNCLAITETCFAEIEGFIRLNNVGALAETANIQIVHIPAGQAQQIIDSQTVTIQPGGFHDFTIGSATYGFPRIGSMPTLNVGDQICVQWDGVTISGQTTGPNVQVDFGLSFWQIRCLDCEEDPFLNEDDIYNIPQYSLLTDFVGCSGVQTKTIESDFYTGLGFAFSQQIQGLKDYSDTYFITYRAPGGGARRFPKCFYFQDTYTQACEARVGEMITFQYYNAPIQLPHLLNNLLCQIPSPVRVPSYTFDITVDAAGQITKTKTQTFVELQGTGKLNVITFENCAKEYDLVRAIQYGEVNIDLCGFQGTAIIRDFGMTLGNDRKGTYEVLI